jgi:hypothetical protein
MIAFIIPHLRTKCLTTYKKLKPQLLIVFGDVFHISACGALQRIFLTRSPSKTCAGRWDWAENVVDGASMLVDIGYADRGLFPSAILCSWTFRV